MSERTAGRKLVNDNLTSAEYLLIELHWSKTSRIHLSVLKTVNFTLAKLQVDHGISHPVMGFCSTFIHWFPYGNQHSNGYMEEKYCAQLTEFDTATQQHMLLPSLPTRLVN